MSSAQRKGFAVNLRDVVDNRQKIVQKRRSTSLDFLTFGNILYRRQFASSPSIRLFYLIFFQARSTAFSDLVPKESATSPIRDSCQDDDDMERKLQQHIYGSCPRYDRRGDSCSPCYGSLDKGVGRRAHKWERCASHSPASSVERMIIDSPLAGDRWTPPTASSLLTAGSPQMEAFRGRSPHSAGEDTNSVLSFSLRWVQFDYIMHYFLQIRNFCFLAKMKCYFQN
jgi:hypothetical protein